MPVKFDRPMVKRLFDKTDTDGSGGLDREEIAVLAASLGTNADLAAFDNIDTNENGIVEFDEFFAWYNKFSDKLAELKEVAEAERAEAEAQIARWAETHASRAEEHERQWAAQTQKGRTVREPKPPGSPRMPPRRSLGGSIDTRAWRLQSFVLSGCGKVLDGVWVVDDSKPLVHEKPHFVNQYGCHAFFAPAPARWVLQVDLATDGVDDSLAIRECADGGETDFPLGDHTWKVRREHASSWGQPQGPSTDTLLDSRVELTLRIAARNRPPSIGGLGCLNVLLDGQQPQDPPTAQEVGDYACHLGISTETDQHLLWVAEEALCAPLPAGWVEHVEAETGHVFFRGPGVDGRAYSTHWHPLEEQYKTLLHQLRELVGNVHAELKNGDTQALDVALATYEAAVQEHREQLQQLLATENEDARSARRLRFRFGVFAVRTVLARSWLPPTKDAPPKRAKSGAHVEVDAYFPEAFAAHYPARAKAISRLRAEGHDDAAIKDIESTLRRIVRSDPSLRRRGAHKLLHALHYRVPAKLPPRGTALAAKSSAARLKGNGMSILTAAELTRHLAHIRTGSPVSGHAGEHDEQDAVENATATRLEKQRLGYLHMADRAGADTLMPLHVAARKGDADTVAHLLLDGADVNRQNFAGQTPLHEAAIAGRDEVVDLLLGESGVRTPFFCFCVGTREELRKSHPAMDWKARNKEMSVLWHGTPATNATFTGSIVVNDGVECAEFPGWDFRQNPEQLTVEVDGVVKTAMIAEDCRTLDRATEVLSRAFCWDDEELDALQAHEESHSVHPAAQRNHYAKILHASVEDALHPIKLPNAFAREMQPICRVCAAGKTLGEKELHVLTQNEFGFSPADAFDIPLSELAHRVPEGYSKLGKVAAGYVSKMLESKMPADFTAVQAAQYLKDEYKLGPGRTDSVLLHGVTMQPRERCTDAEQAKSFLDSCAAAYGDTRRVTISRSRMLDNAPVSALETLLVLLALKFLRPVSDITAQMTIRELNKCPAKHNNHVRHDALLAAQAYFKGEQHYEREIAGGIEDLIGAESRPHELATMRITADVKEIEADYKEKLGKLMALRQKRRWDARRELTKRRLARVQELREESGNDVCESIDEFQARMGRNFLQGIDTLRTKRMIVDEIAYDRLWADSGLATRAIEEYGVSEDHVAAALQSATPKKALIALIVERNMGERESFKDKVERFLREAGPVTDKARRLRLKLETIHHVAGLESLESDLHRVELLKYAENAGVNPALLQAAGEVDPEDRERALIALILDQQVVQLETSEEHIARLLNEASRRTNADDYDDLRMALDNIEVTSMAEIAMREEEKFDEEELAMFANEKAKLDVTMVRARAEASAAETTIELESNEQFHKRTGRLFNPKKGDKKLPRLASYYLEDTAKALEKIQQKRLMARGTITKTLADVQKRKMRVLPWATVTANANDKLVITSGSTGLKSTIKVSGDSGKHALGLFGTQPKLANGCAVRVPLSAEKRKPFITKSIQCSRLCSKINPEPVDKWGHTPLHVAARWAHKEVVQLILNHGGLIDGHGKRYTDSLFLRGNDAVELAAQLRKICLIQGRWRYRAYQRWFTAWRSSVIVLQNRWRFRAARKGWHDRRNAVITMQALFRGYKGRKRFAQVKQQQAAPQLHLAWAQFCSTTGRDHVCMLYRMGDCPHHTAAKCLDMQLPEWEEGGEMTLRDELKKIHLEYLAPRRSTPANVEPPREDWKELIQVCKKAGVSVPMVEAYGATHGGSNEPKRAEVLHFLKKPEVQKHLDLCGELISQIHGPGMCFRNAADPDGTRVSKRGASSFVSTNLYFSTSVPDGCLDVEAIRKSVSRLQGFVQDPTKFRVTDDNTALMVFFESESCASQAMNYLQSNSKALPRLTEVVFGKQAKDKSSKSQAKALFLELDDDGSGFLDSDEVDALMKRMGKWLNKFELAQCMAAMDEDGNDEVSLAEFEEWFKLNGNKFSHAEDVELTKLVEEDGRKALQAVDDARPIHTIPEDELRAQGASGWASKAQRFSTGRSAEALKNRWTEIVHAEEKKPQKQISRMQQIRQMREKQAASFAEQAQQAAIQQKEDEKRAQEQAAAQQAVEQAISLQHQHEDRELAAIECKQNLEKLRDANRCVVGDTRALSDDTYAMACALIQRTTVRKPLLTGTDTAGRHAAEQAAKQIISSEQWAGSSDVLVVASSGAS